MDDRTITLDRPRPDELEVLAELAARCQEDPNRHCVYLGEDAASIAADIGDVPRWTERLVVARSSGGDPIGWLLADADDEVDRVWWWGPFVSDDHDWGTVADRLYEHARDTIFDGPGSGPSGEEAAADERSELFAAFAARHGFAAEESSVCLVLRPDGDGSAPASVADGVSIVPLAPGHHPAVAALHDDLFPGTHSTGRAIVDTEDARSERLPRSVAILDGGVVGYVATEHQHDGSLYVDFVGVAPGATRRGIGRALVDAACRDGFARGATFAHLTVRTSNTAARALYRSLGFEEERVLVPYRRGVGPQ